MRKIRIKIQVNEERTFVLEPMKVNLPEYKTKDSAGCDLTINGECSIPGTAHGGDGYHLPGGKSYDW